MRIDFPFLGPRRTPVRLVIDAKADDIGGVVLTVAIGRHRIRGGLTADEVFELAQLLEEAASEAAERGHP